MAYYTDGVLWQDYVQQDLSEYLAEELGLSTTHSGDWYIEPTDIWDLRGGYGEFIIGEEIYDAEKSADYTELMELSLTCLSEKMLDISISNREVKRIMVDDFEFDRMYDILGDTEPAAYRLRLKFHTFKEE